MLATDESAVICDLAEVYNIYDYRRVPTKLLGTLVAGLGENTRIGRKINKVKGNTDTIILARILDAVNILVWMNTKDAEKGRNRPKSIVSEFLEVEDKDKPVSMSIDDFDRYRQSFFNKKNAEEVKNGG